MRPLRPLCVLPILVLLAARPATAAWPGDPTANVALCTMTAGQRYPEAAPDGTGGAIVAWDDQRGGPRDIYVQRVNGAGIVRWAAGGVALCTAAGEQYEPEIVSDGSGGAIVTWSDFRGAAFDIYAQRIDSTGAVKWTANGVAICTAVDFQSNPAIVADGSGGAIIAWADARSGIDRIYAQRVNANGVPQWPANGVALTNSPSGQARPVLVSNGAGGAIVAWEDYRNGEVDLFAQRILSSGALDPLWPAGGRAFALSWGDQDAPVLAVDGSGGAVVAWGQWNGLTRDIVVQHLLASGAIDPAWPAGGRKPVADFFDQSSPALVSDGAGGALVSWDDQRGGRDIYAHRVLSTGALDPGWPATGRLLCGAAGEQVDPRMVPDGTGGALVAWVDQRDDEGDVYAHHVTAAGDADSAWPADGRALTMAVRAQGLPSIVADGAGGAVVVWMDGRSPVTENDDVYAQRVDADGDLGQFVDVPRGGGLDLALEALRPNPARGGAMVVRFTLPEAGAASLELFDVAGRRVAAHELGALGAGRHAVDLAPGPRSPAGVYFVRLRQGAAARVERITILDE